MDRGVNDHDLGRILSHYADSVELKSLRGEAKTATAV